MQLDQRETLVLSDGRRIHMRAKPCDHHRCFQWQVGSHTRCGFKSPEAALQDARDMIAQAP